MPESRRTFLGVVGAGLAVLFSRRGARAAGWRRGCPPPCCQPAAPCDGWPAAPGTAAPPAGGLATAPGGPPGAGPVPRELLEKRRDAARITYEEMIRRLRGRGNVTSTELCEWSEHWLQAELALTDDQAARIAALRAHLDRTREVERMADRAARAGQGFPSEATAARYYRLGAEIRLFQATGQTPPVPPEEDQTPTPNGTLPHPKERKNP